MLQKILFSNFMGQNRQSGSNLSDLLDKSEGVMALLEEDTFISEFKSGYNRIKEFMTYERFQELLTLVTVVGEEKDKKRSYRYPLTASELLSSDNSKIQEYFLPSEPTVNIERTVTRSIEKEIEQEIEDDDEEEELGPAADKPEGAKDEVEEGAQKAKEEKVDDEKEKKEGEAAQSGLEEEEFGEFVQAPPKKKKIVKVKEVVEQTETIIEHKQPLLFTLFRYFSEPINYTLTGYVCKILISLLNKKPLTFMQKLFEKPDPKVFQDFFSHLGSRSMVDFLTRLYSIENKSYLEERSKMMGEMMNYLLQGESTDTLTNIGACVSEVYQKVTANVKTPTAIKQLSIFTNKIPEYLNLLLELFKGDNPNANLHCIPIMNLLLAYFDIKQQYQQVQTFMEQYVGGVTSRLKTYLQEDRKRLGPQAVRIVESINHCIKAEQLQDLLSHNQELFPTLLSLVRKFPLNNIFHNEVEKLITTSLASSPALVRNVVESSNLLNWLEIEAKEEQQRRKDKKQSKKGYFGHLFVICRCLKQQSQKHPAVSEVVEDPRFGFIVKVIMEQEEVSTQKMLGGLSKKNTKHTVMHSKEDILEAYSSFLSKTPTPVLEQDLEDPLLNPILIEELQKQLDGVEISNDKVPEAVVVEEKHKAELIEENEHHKSAFWKMHLDYDVDGLIDELV